MLSTEEIRQQAVIMYKSLEKLPKTEREKNPSSHFGDRYNQLLLQAQQAISDPTPENWPPKLPVSAPTHIGPKVTSANYVEIEIYAKQIASRLAEHIEPPNMLVG